MIRELTHKRRRRSVLALGILSLAMSFMSSCVSPDSSRGSVFVSGLTNPRGIAFNPDGILHIAEAGNTDTPGRILRREPDGSLTTLVDDLPFTPGADAAGEDVGISGLAFDGQILYAVVGEGVNELSSFVLRLAPGRTMQAFASLWLTESLRGLGTQDSGTNPYDVTVQPGTGRVFVVDSALNRILRISESGDGFDIFADLTDDSGSGPVPTGLVFGPDKRLYVAIFTSFPHSERTGSVLVLDAEGAPTAAVTGLTTPIDVAFDARGRMYVLQFSSGFDPQKQPGFLAISGSVVRIDPEGHRVVAEGLNFPVSMAFGPDGDLYVSANGAFEESDSGSVLRIQLDRGG